MPPSMEETDDPFQHVICLFSVFSALVTYNFQFLKQ